jgi:ABC-type polysaccharide/polyol phosphate transport system ATPase subunit
MSAVVVLDDVSKKFQLGERHNSLRDLLPALFSASWRSGQDQPGEFWALRHVSFEVEAGKALGIIGSNGAGKSTTLKILTKILKPTTGYRHVRGRIGALIEIAAGFHPDLTGRENVFLQGAIMGMKRAEIAQRFDAIVEFAGIESFIDTPVKRYSSGMNARLGFSIAAHLNPDALIIDEVLSVGDMAFRQRCFERMLKFKREGVAIVFVSHNLHQIANLCDEAIHLAGTVQAKGPATDVVAGYVRATRQAPTTSAEEPIEIESVSFEGSADAGDAHREVVPGTPLTLHVSARTAQPLDEATFGFLIHRSTDQLLVYDGQIRREDLGPSEEFADEFEIAFTFTAHMVRSHYYVSLYVLRPSTQTYLLAQRPIATLAVRETRSWGGIADIQLNAGLVGAGRERALSS